MVSSRASHTSKILSSQRKNPSPPQTWRRICGLFWQVVRSPCSRESIEPSPLAVARGRSPTSKRGGRRETIYRAPPYDYGFLLPGGPCNPVDRSSLHTKYLLARATYVRFHTLPALLRTFLTFRCLRSTGHCSRSNLLIASTFSCGNEIFYSVRDDCEP